MSVCAFADARQLGLKTFSPLWRRIFLVFSHHYFQVRNGFRAFDESCNALDYYLKVIKLIIVSSKSSY